jgi:hypothetical protein
MFKEMTLKREQIQKAIKNEAWQDFRKGLKGLSTTSKLNKLSNYLKQQGNSPVAQVRVENYKNALKRGGQIK